MIPLRSIKRNRFCSVIDGEYLAVCCFQPEQIVGTSTISFAKIKSDIYISRHGCVIRHHNKIRFTPFRHIAGGNSCIKLNVILGYISKVHIPEQGIGRTVFTCVIYIMMYVFSVSGIACHQFKRSFSIRPTRCIYSTLIILIIKRKTARRT